jgi:putative salt-induced outer membrane protein YdiY
VLKNIEYRATLGSGMGYQIIDTSKTTWDIAGGPAYRTTQFVSVESGQDSNEGTPAFVMSTHFDTELTKRIDLNIDYNFQILNEKSGRFTHHSVMAFETELTKWLDFDISLI